MQTNKTSPIQLVGASFASGIFAAFVYNKYVQRVQQQQASGGSRSRFRTFDAEAPRGNVDPISALFSQNDIGLHVLNHLTRVYAALGGTTLAGVAGVILQQKTNFSAQLAGLISLGLAFSMSFQRSQLWKLLCFGLFNGMSLGGIIKLANIVNPSIVPIALGSTTLMFSSFAAAATLSTRRSLLFLYGGLGSVLSVLSVTGLANMFFQSRALFNINLYAGLAMFMGYVMADSQLIIERADRGDEDYVTHAWLLFTDLSGIFTRILVILLQNEEEERKKKQARNNKKGRRDDEFYD